MRKNNNRPLSTVHHFTSSNTHICLFYFTWHTFQRKAFIEVDSKSELTLDPNLTKLISLLKIVLFFTHINWKVLQIRLCRHMQPS